MKLSIEGVMSANSQKQGVITLIEKEGKNAMYVKLTRRGPLAIHKDR